MIKKHRLCQLVTAGVITLIAACGGGTPGPASLVNDGSELRTDVAVAPTAPVLADPVSIDAFALFPGLIELRQSEVTGLMVGYTAQDQIATEIEFFDAVWRDLSDCLGVVASAALIVVQDESVEPLTGGDDIFLDFFGRLSASANDGETGASIQILEDQVRDETGGSSFILRSIIGRYLWRSNDLPERDFDTACVVVSGA